MKGGKGRTGRERRKEGCMDGRKRKEVRMSRKETGRKNTQKGWDEREGR